MKKSVNEKIILTAREEMEKIEKGERSRYEANLIVGGYLKALCEVGLISKEEYVEQAHIAKGKFDFARQRYYTRGE